MTQSPSPISAADLTAFVMVSEAHDKTQGWHWHLYLMDGGGGHLIPASSVGCGHFESPQAAIEHFRTVQRMMASAEVRELEGVA